MPSKLQDRDNYTYSQKREEGIRPELIQAGFTYIVHGKTDGKNGV